MSDIQWKILTKVYDRVEGEMMKEALEALGIPAELVRESAAGLYPTTFGSIAETHVFVPSEKFDEASAWLEMYENDEAEVDEE